MIKLIMSDCQSRTTITETRNSLMTTSSFVDGKEEKADIIMKNEAVERETKKKIRLQSAPYPLNLKPDEDFKKIEFVVAGNYAPFPAVLDLTFPYSAAEDVNYEAVEQQEVVQSKTTRWSTGVSGVVWSRSGRGELGKWREVFYWCDECLLQ